MCLSKPSQKTGYTFPLTLTNLNSYPACWLHISSPVWQRSEGAHNHTLSLYHLIASITFKPLHLEDESHLKYCCTTPCMVTWPLNNNPWMSLIAHHCMALCPTYLMIATYRMSLCPMYRLCDYARILKYVIIVALLVGLRLGLGFKYVIIVALLSLKER